VSVLVRLLNLEAALPGGVPQVPPGDDLYHAKRMAYTAAHPGRVLDFDADRGVDGAFCPWPPLYDLGVGSLARLCGLTTPRGVLSLAVWLPPFVSGLVLAGFTFLLARRLGTLPALVGAAALAFSPSLLQVSQLSSIDHHFLEPALVLSILAAVLGLSKADTRRAALRRGLALGLALSLALFVQTALLVSAALAFAAVLLVYRERDDALAGAGIGFGAAALAVAVYRSTRPNGYPETAWFLGWPHAAALFAAAIAVAVLLMLRRRRS
jgi:asparagine N-glycosylation enzyme membrane subunit Stt3